jgi:hypothetical protein
LVVRKIPDELVEHYLGRSGFHCPDLRLWVLFQSLSPMNSSKLRFDQCHGIIKVRNTNYLISCWHSVISCFTEQDWLL